MKEMGRWAKKHVLGVVYCLEWLESGISQKYCGPSQVAWQQWDESLRPQPDWIKLVRGFFSFLVSKAHTALQNKL